MIHRNTWRQLSVPLSVPPPRKGAIEHECEEDEYPPPEGCENSRDHHIPGQGASRLRRQHERDHKKAKQPQDKDPELCHPYVQDTPPSLCARTII